MSKRIKRPMAGWQNYFNFGYTQAALRQLNHFVQERLIRPPQRRRQRPIKPGENESYPVFFKRLGWKNR